MKKIKISKIETTKIAENVWVAKTTFFTPAKTDVEIKGITETNAYVKLKGFLKFNELPKGVESLENGNKIYHF